MPIYLNTKSCLLAAALVSGSLLTGCIYSAVNTAASAAAVEEVEQNEAFRQGLDEAYQEYLEEMKTSGCPAEEYRINSEIYQYVKDEGDEGLANALEKLESIHQDTALRPPVRAEAVYYIGVIYTSGPEQNLKLAEDYMTILKTQFPGNRDCIADWWLKRIESMNEKALEAIEPAQT